jgi:serine O-acetyltransferase
MRPRIVELFLEYLRGYLFDPSGHAVKLIYRLSAPDSDRITARFKKRMAWISLVRKYGCYVSTSAKIGRGLVLPHPIGIVVGEGAIVGDFVTIYQHVTLGRLRAETDAYPIVEDNVVLFSGAVVLGGIKIGRGSVIGAHSVVIHDVPPYSLCVGAPARIVKKLTSVIT